jgi:hypothetical protein
MHGHNPRRESDIESSLINGPIVGSVNGLNGSLNGGLHSRSTAAAPGSTAGGLGDMFASSVHHYAGGLANQPMSAALADTYRYSEYGSGFNT